MVTKVFISDPVYPHFLLHLGEALEDWVKVSHKYFLIHYLPDDPVQPDLRESDILISDNRSSMEFIDRIRREAAEG